MKTDEGCYVQYGVSGYGVATKLWSEESIDSRSGLTPSVPGTGLNFTVISKNQLRLAS
jgi:hypothetical protein